MNYKKYDSYNNYFTNNPLFYMTQHVRKLVLESSSQPPFPGGGFIPVLLSIQSSFLHLHSNHFSLNLEVSSNKDLESQQK